MGYDWVKLSSLLTSLHAIDAMGVFWVLQKYVRIELGGLEVEAL